MGLEEALQAIDLMLENRVFGSAASRIIIEYLEGEEASFFALVDGENVLPLESAQDHKRVGDGDTGLNTGGMGAYSPAPVLTKELESIVMESIILPTVKGMFAEGYCKFVGVLYAGLMIEKKSGMPKLIEYNVRFGDPECQEGYPGPYKKGTIIRKLEEAELVSPTVKIFHAGTAVDSAGNFVAAGGRVLGITVKEKDIEDVRESAYAAVAAVDWPEGFFRRVLAGGPCNKRHSRLLNISM